jgi:hypothetical protein
LQGVKWYLAQIKPPIPLNEMVTREDYTFNLQQGFSVLEEDLPPDWDKRGDVVRKIVVLERLNSLATTQKLKYTDNSVGQALDDILLLDEIREFRKTGNLNDCQLLQGMLETSDAGLTPEALVTKLWLRYESYRTVLAYLNRLEFNVTKMLEEEQIDQANDLLNGELEKIRI